MPQTLIKIQGTVLELLDDGFLVEQNAPRLLASESYRVAITVEDKLPGLDSLGEALSQLDEVEDTDLRDLVVQLVNCKYKPERKKIAEAIEAWCVKLQNVRESLHKRFKALAQDVDSLEIEVETGVLP